MDTHTLESRIKGSLWGLAVGDALGAPYEFRHRGTYVPSKNMVTCTTFSHNVDLVSPLPPGSWTDDTSMQAWLQQWLTYFCSILTMICSYAWLCRCQAPKESLIGWMLHAGGRAGGSTLLDPKCPRPTHLPNMNPEIEASGNGSLMRLSPVPAALHRDPFLAIQTASLQSKITHSSPLCVDSCVLATAYMIGFYHAEANTAKERKQVVLNPDFTPFSDGTPIPLESPELMDLHKQHRYKERIVADVETSGYVLHTLEAALWALWHSDTFEEGLMLLLPLGSDVDTVGAVYGELAGACYGYDEIPTRWLETLQRRDILHDTYKGIIDELHLDMFGTLWDVPSLNKIELSRVAQPELQVETRMADIFADEFGTTIRNKSHAILDTLMLGAYDIVEQRELLKRYAMGVPFWVYNALSLTIDQRNLAAAARVSALDYKCN
ncbi:ADP-ribosylglycohydrolase domain-containing protein [Rhizoctonia solani AG-1 IA]|uniref:ADP-ribosylhydrolase ARH3 n=1 Tax=Thanatephorus cucumeris (strain AG1-IA) TaxID=983506 RepID=L8X272_THACA|nr:ADP-ribosylglycohydrolase domain-containing protein [Rhizoctonia solani AG-1 IA]